MGVAIAGAGLAELATAVGLVDAGQGKIFESRLLIEGIGSWVDADGNPIEMGLHVFFGCYYQLFDLIASTPFTDQPSTSETLPCQIG